MFPRETPVNVVDVTYGHAELGCQQSGCDALLEQAPDCANLLAGQLCNPMTFFYGPAPFGNRVLSVLLGSPDEEVIGAHTCRHVAMMADLEALGNRASCPDIRKPVGWQTNVVGMRYANPAIASLQCGASPQPTSGGAAGLVNVCPEPVIKLSHSGYRTTRMTTVASPAYGAPAREGLELFPTLFALGYHRPSTKRRPLGSAVFAEDTRELRGHNRKRRQSCKCPQHG